MGEREPKSVGTCLTARCLSCPRTKLDRLYLIPHHVDHHMTFPTRLGQPKPRRDRLCASPETVLAMAPPSSKVSRNPLLLAYLAQLSQHPLRTKALTTGEYNFDSIPRHSRRPPRSDRTLKGHCASYKRSSAPTWPASPSGNPPKMRPSIPMCSHVPGSTPAPSRWRSTASSSRLPSATSSSASCRRRSPVGPDARPRSVRSSLAT
jgi:hypothetical protein